MEWERAFIGAAGITRELQSSTALKAALCALEVLANADDLADDYVAIPIEIPDEVAVQVISIADFRKDGTQTSQSMRLGTSERIGRSHK